MDKILREDHHHHQDELSPTPPPLKRTVDFVASGLPLGMGLLKLGNFLYMFGGENRNESERESESENSDTDNNGGRYSGGISRHSLVDGATLLGENPPSPVYKLDLTNNLSEPLQLSSMFGPKLYAIVEEIGGQIYVLSQKPVSHTSPLFEVWNPMTDQWRALPNPPLFSDGMDIWSYCVCDGKIICKMKFGSINRFFIASETWDCVETLSSSESMAMNDKNVSSDKHSKNVYFTKGRGYRNLLAFMDGPISMELEFDRSKTEPEIAGFTPLESVILVDTSQHGEYMCGLVPYDSLNVYGFGLYVFVFQVEKLKLLSPSRPTLTVKYLRRRFYDFTNIRCRNEEFSLFNIKKAVM